MFLVFDDAAEAYRVLLGMQAAAHGVAHDGRLFVDFLHHEVVETGLFDAVEVHLQLLHVGDGFHVLDGLDVQFFAQFDAHNLLVFKVNHLLRAAHDGGGVRGDEILTLTDADDHRAAFAGGDEHVRMPFFDDGDGVSAHNVVQGDTHGLEKIHMLTLLHVLDKVGEHLGVGRRLELVAALLQFLSQAEVVLYNAVVDEGDVARHGTVRVGIHLVGFAVGGPAGVGDADVPTDVFVSGKSLQIRDFPLRLVDVQLVCLVEQGHSRAVVAAVFQTF